MNEYAGQVQEIVTGVPQRHLILAVYGCVLSMAHCRDEVDSAVFEVFLELRRRGLIVKTFGKAMTRKIVREISEYQPTAERLPVPSNDVVILIDA